MAGGGLEAQAFVGLGRGHASLGGAFEVALHDEEGLVGLLDGVRLLAHGDGDCGEAHGATAELEADGLEYLDVHLVEAVGVYLQEAEGIDRDLLGDEVVGLHLSVVAHAAEEVVGDTGGAARAGGDLECAVRLDRHAELGGGAGDDLGELGGFVVGESVHEAEPRAQRGGDEADAGGCAHEGEAGELEAYGAGVGALVDHDVDREVLHRGVEILLDGLGHAVDLVDEDDVAGLKGGEQAGEVARLGEDWAGGGLDAHAHGVAEDVGEGCLAETGGTGEEDVVERLAAVLGGLHGELESVADLPLADEVGELLRAELVVERGVASVQLFACSVVVHVDGRGLKG